MSKSIKLKNNNYWDTSSVSHNRKSLKETLNSIDNKLTSFDDTKGSDIKEMLRNKLAYGDSVCSGEQNAQIFLNGGWSGNNYGFGIYAKCGNTRHVVWFSTFGLYMCRIYNNQYDYKSFTMNTL